MKLLVLNEPKYDIVICVIINSTTQVFSDEK